MLQVIAYFVLNILGFFFFYAVWCCLPKPKPVDYTTIPGLKLDVADADEIPSMVVEPGEEVDESFPGHWPKIKAFADLRTFLQFMHAKYGPLNSFYWSNRFVVSVCTLALVDELSQYKDKLLAVSPLALGSYLQADKKFCSRIRNRDLPSRISTNDDHDDELAERGQEELFMRCSQVLHGTKSQATDVSTEKILGTTKNVYLHEASKTFDVEVELDAHPIPPFVPVVFNMETIFGSNLNNEELLKQFGQHFAWLPGWQTFQNAEDFLRYL